MRQKQIRQQITKYLNSIFRARGRSFPSSRGSRRFFLGSNLRKIPQYTIQIFGLSLLSVFFINHAVSALTYQSSTDLQFTFNPTVTVNLSSSDLVINDLSPGTYADSNIITVTAGTNVASGFTLTATAGNGTTYSNTNLVGTGGSFTSLSTTGEGIASMDSADPNKWGYSFSTDNGITWYNYMGLPYYSDAGAELLATNTNTSASIKFKIAARAANDQPSGAYHNVVNFYAVANPEVDNSLYGKVAEMSKGKQTAAQLQAAITVPTSADRTQDTSNSGVYEYDSSVFGASSDASNDNPIYYYRGVLENSVGSYGSDGSATTYPNYVILDADGTKTTSDTCWRIVRTTGSGGVKMIYNGKWTGSTCANSTTNANAITSSSPDGTSAFNGTSSTNRQIVRAGYTHNSTYATSTAKTASIADVLGANSNPGVNNTDSTIKNYIEDTWFPNISSYESILEPSAGYCNDRTMNTGSDWTTPLAESTSITTYGTEGMTVYYFGAKPRNGSNAQLPSLTCAKYNNVDRSTVDLYTTSSALNGNKQLSKPVALLTADESSFAGSGSSTASYGSSYHVNSFLRSGGHPFWVLSPYWRYSLGSVRVYVLSAEGSVSGVNDVNSAFGVRPVISLSAGIAPSSGSGVATDPWVVQP